MKKYEVSGLRGSVTVDAPDEHTARSRAMEALYGPSFLYPHIVGVVEDEPRDWHGDGLSAREIPS